MKCPNCGSEDPIPLPSDNGTTTCPRCGYRFPIDERVPAASKEPLDAKGQPVRHAEVAAR